METFVPEQDTIRPADTDDFMVIEQDTGSKDTTYVEPTALSGVAYEYVVRSINPQGMSDLSPPILVMGSSTLAPTTPTGFNAVVQLRDVQMTWDDPADGTITGYRILRRALGDVDSEYEVLIDSTNGQGTQFSDEDVTSGPHAHKLLAINAAGFSRSTASVSVVVVE